MIAWSVRCRALLSGVPRVRAVLAAGAFACCVVAEGAAMDPLFALIDEMRQAQPIRQEWLEQRLRVSFIEQPALSTEYFRVLHAPSSSEVREVKAVELRIPVAESATSGPLVVIDVDSAVRCIAQDEIEKHYGANPALQVPTPRQPPSSPLNYEYRFPWGRLSFGVSRTAPECLTRVVVDYVKASR